MIRILSKETKLERVERIPFGISSTKPSSICEGLRSDGFLRMRHGFSTSVLPSHEVLTMPALSPTMTEGTISSWKKEEGDALQAGDVLAEIETDKATMEMECMDEGYLAKILVPSGTTSVSVGTPVVVIVSNPEDVSSFQDYVPASNSSSSAETKSKDEDIVSQEASVSQATEPREDVMAMKASSMESLVEDVSLYKEETKCRAPRSYSHDANVLHGPKGWLPGRRGSSSFDVA